MPQEDKQVKGIKKLIQAIGSFNFQQMLGSVPFLLFLALLAVVYIGNTHMAERYVREINRIDRELKELRWNYMSNKSDLMFNSKQSEVEEATADMGLRSLRNPPKKIVVQK